jgi:methanogenic corrinoid protein MtbC1
MKTGVRNLIEGYSEFVSMMRAGDRSRCLEWAMERLKDGRIDVLTLYRDVLAPTLGEKDCSESGDACILNEHLRSSIIRTIVENAYPFVIAERMRRYGDRIGKRVLVTSPSEEYHDLAPRMAADLFALAGFDVIFLGANTPTGVIAAAVDEYKPDIVSISVSNYYHIPATAKEIRNIRSRFGKAPFIAVGGAAFYDNPNAWKEIGADRVLRSYEDIASLAKEG